MPDQPVSQAKIGPMQAFPVAMQDIEALVADYYPYIRRLATSILDDPHEAEDAAQDTFIADSQTLGIYRGEANPKTWLTGQRTLLTWNPSSTIMMRLATLAGSRITMQEARRRRPSRMMT
jgi:hypothetical protein